MTQHRLSVCSKNRTVFAHIIHFVLFSRVHHANFVQLTFFLFLFFFAANVEENQLTLLSTSQTPHCGTPTHGANPAWAMVTLNLPTGRSVAIRSLGASQIQQGNGHSLGRCTRQDSSHLIRHACSARLRSNLGSTLDRAFASSARNDLVSPDHLPPPPPRQARRDVPEFRDPPIQDKFFPCVVEPLAAPHHQRQLLHCEETHRSAVHKQVWCPRPTGIHQTEEGRQGPPLTCDRLWLELADPDLGSTRWR